MARNLDLQLVGRYFENELPKEKRYLLKYFRSELQSAFLHYYHIFNDYDNFVDHTGMYCQKRWLVVLLEKLKILEKIHKEAKEGMDFTLLAQIEKGKYKLSKEFEL